MTVTYTGPASHEWGYVDHFLNRRQRIELSNLPAPEWSNGQLRVRATCNEYGEKVLVLEAEVKEGGVIPENCVMKQ